MKYHEMYWKIIKILILIRSLASLKVECNDFYMLIVKYTAKVYYTNFNGKNNLNIWILKGKLDKTLSKRCKTCISSDTTWHEQNKIVLWNKSH